MFNRIWVRGAVGAAVLAGLVAGSAYAWGDLRRTTHLTFSGAVALPNVVLPAGSYTFELADSNATHNAVRVLTRDRSTLYFTGFTVSVQRPRGMDPNRMVTLGEAERGAPPRIIAWYPVGSSIGHQFIYEGR